MCNNGYVDASMATARQAHYCNTMMHVPRTKASIQVAYNKLIEGLRAHFTSNDIMYM